jgi:hypothetical protein
MTHRNPTSGAEPVWKNSAVLATLDRWIRPILQDNQDEHLSDNDRLI